ncbi:extracellular solute-binding protein [Alcaligenaceae bacterium CGII-47]|nr:extracellular solute-binding protein [Alcaligenaceae bacterium CGII-47]
MMKFKISLKHLGRTLWCALFCVLAFSSVKAETPPPSGSPDVWSYLNKQAPDARLAIMKKEALREGSMTIYGALGIDRANVLIQSFSKQYPEIKVDFVRLREPELVQRVNTEAGAKQVHGDLAISNVAWLDLLKDSLGHYQPTSWENYKKNFVFGSDADGWTAVAYEVLPSTIAWRTDRVSQADAPRTLQEIIDPKWKGRVGTTSHLETLMDGLIDVMGEEKAMPFIDQLAALDNRLYPSIASLADALSQGEIDVAWNMGAHRAVKLKGEGAPVDFVMQDPLLGLGITVSVIDGAKNSYAAALFMEYLTRADTLEAVDKAEGGRIFGNSKGKYQIDLATLPSLTLFKAIPPEKFNELSQLVEAKFLRRR